MLLKEYDVVKEPYSWHDNLKNNDSVMVFVIKTDALDVEQERFVLIGMFVNTNGNFYLHGDPSIIPGNDNIVLFKLYENQTTDLREMIAKSPNLNLGNPITHFESGQLIIGEMVPTEVHYLRIPLGFSQDDHLTYKWVFYTDDNLNAVRESTNVVSIGGKRSKRKRKHKRKRTRRV